MSNNLYLEAIEAAEEIKLAAEERVKQRLIESMTPQIKSLVEQKLFEDNVEEETELLNDEDSNVKEASDCVAEEIDEGTITSILTKNAKFTEVSLKLNNIKNGIKNLKEAKILIESNGRKANENKKFIQLYKLLLKEIKNLRSNSIIKNNDNLLKEFYNINKEIYNMSKRRSYNELDHLLEMNLFEDDEVVDEEETEDAEEPADKDMMDMPEDEPEDESIEDLGSDADDLEQVLRDIVARAEEALDSDSGEEVSSDEEVPSDDEESSDDEELMDLTDGLYEIDEMINAGDEVPDENLEESNRRDRVLEIDENMLRREIGRMKSIREGEAKEMASHFGGGSLEGEAFVDGVQLNKLHEIKTKAAKVIRKNRMLESKLSQYKKALRGMKGQLSEMNLFNAKLLYANKLMQNRDLSMKQQRHIVESLDEAKTMGEAKILFESLSKTLVSSRPAKRSGNLTEGAIRPRTGSASAPVKSAQPLNESLALDRWATLAGIKK